MKKIWIVTGAMVGVLIVGWSGPRVVQAESQGGGLPAVHEEVTALQATVASLETALTAERQARQAAEAALQKSVSSIQTDFASALNAESAARRAADAAIQSEIADILRRVSALGSRATTVENLVTSLRLSMSFAELNIADIQRHLQATQLDGHVFTATGQDTPSLQNNEATVVSVVVPPGQYLIQ